MVTADQRMRLAYGRAYFGDGEFEDEEDGRRAWYRCRDDLMAGWDHPGRRPWGFWRYEFGAWQEHGGATEEEVVHAHLADAAERAKIEARWHQSLRCAITSSLPAPNPAPRDIAIGLHGVPGWFYDQRAPLAIKQFKAGSF